MNRDDAAKYFQDINCAAIRYRLNLRFRNIGITALLLFFLTPTLLPPRVDIEHFLDLLILAAFAARIIHLLIKSYRIAGVKFIANGADTHAFYYREWTTRVPAIAL